MIHLHVEMLAAIAALITVALLQIGCAMKNYGDVFTYDVLLSGSSCSGEGLLFSYGGLSLLHCLTICYRSRRQACVGVFYKESHKQCFGCSGMDTDHLVTMAETIALRRYTCSQYLVQSVVDSQLTQSSFYGNIYHTANYARLDTIETLSGTGGWTPQPTDPFPYVQVDFLKLKRVSGVVTQGRSGVYNTLQYVTQYRVQKSTDCSNWEFVIDRDGVIQYFPGNSDEENHVINLFDDLVIAMCIRVNPTLFNSFPSMRFDVLGCDLD